MKSCESPSRVQYINRGCRCDACRAICATYESQRRRDRAYGRPTSFVDAAPVYSHIAALKAAGMSNREICRAASVSTSALGNVYYKHQRTGKPISRMKRETAERILAVNRRAISPGQRVNREAVDRTIVELLALGFSIEQQSKLTGVDRQTLDRYRTNSKTVNAITAYRFLANAQNIGWAIGNTPSISRAKNLAPRAAELVSRKWGVADEPFTVTTTDDGFTVRVYDREVTAEKIISPNGKPLKRRATGGKGLAWVYRVGEQEVVGKAAAIEAAYEVAR